MDSIDATSKITMLFIMGIIALKIVAFYLGFRIVRLGHDLIKDGVKGEFKLKASYSGFRADLVSVSPGLLFVALGTCLIAYGIAVKKPVRFAAKDDSAHSSSAPKTPTILIPEN